MNSQFLQENAVGTSAKSFSKIQVDNIHCLSLIHYSGHLAIEGDHISKAGFSIPKIKLAGPDPLVVLHVLHHGTRIDLLHDLPWSCGLG